MKRSIVHVAPLIAILATTLFLAAASAQQRNLSAYDKAVADYINSPQPFVVTRDLQNFLWLHWTQHRRAYVVVRSVTAEGQQMVNTEKRLFIEPRKDGSWCVRVEIQAEVAALRWMPASQKQPTKNITRQFEAVSVEKVGGDQHLVLKDKNGNVVDTIANATAYFQ